MHSVFFRYIIVSVYYVPFANKYNVFNFFPMPYISMITCSKYSDNINIYILFDSQQPDDTRLISYMSVLGIFVTMGC